MARYKMGSNGPQLRTSWFSYKAPRTVATDTGKKKEPAHFIEQARQMDGDVPAVDGSGNAVYANVLVGDGEVFGGVLEKPFDLTEQKTSQGNRAAALAALVVEGEISAERAKELRENWALDTVSGITPVLNLKMSLVDAEAAERYNFTIALSSWSAYHFAARLGSIMPGDEVDLYAFNVKSRNVDGGADNQGLGVKRSGVKLTPADEVCYYPSDDGQQLLPRINNYEGDNKVSSALPSPEQLGPKTIKVGNRSMEVKYEQWVAPVQEAVNRTLSVFIQQQYAHLQQQQETQGQAQGEASADETETAPRPR